MPFDLGRNDEQGTLAEYPPSPDERYCVRNLTPEKMDHFSRMTTKKVRDRTGAYVEERDDKRYFELLYDWLIAGWEGVMFNGVPAECNLENKLKLVGLSSERARFIVDTGILFANDDAARRESEQRCFRGLGQEAPRSAVA